MKPNIILINCDDMGYGDLGCYGSKVNSTPNIDRLAKEGIRFTSWYSPSPVCSPSRGAMMTGSYPPRIGFGDFDGLKVLFPGQGVGLNTEETTISGVLKDNGYSTMIIGKWHCGDQVEFLPLRYGFDEYYGLPYSNDMGRQDVPKRHGNQFNPLPLISQDEVIQQQPDLSTLTERYTEKAIGFIRKNIDKPFFLYFAHMYVHLPHYPPLAFTDKSQNGDFGGCMSGVDWSVAVLCDELERLGLLDNTIIIFTSDNGGRGDHGSSNYPLRGSKATTWEGGQRVPCIWFWKNKISKGNVCDEVCSHMDFLPSLLSTAEIDFKPKNKIDGKNITDIILNNENRSDSDNIFFYYWMNALEAVRVGKWKLFVSRNGEKINELYDLENDISESTNVYEKHTDIVELLNKHIEDMRPILGDSVEGITGSECRPIGRIENPKPLTEYDENHPYIMAMYDSPYSG